MKKLLFIALLAIGGPMFVKSYVTVTQDGQVRVAGTTVPLPPAVQNSPIMGMVTMMMQMQAPPQPAPAAQTYGTPVAGRPPVPTVTSVAGTFNANAPAAQSGQAGAQFGAVAKALNGH